MINDILIFFNMYDNYVTKQCLIILQKMTL